MCAAANPGFGEESINQHANNVSTMSRKQLDLSLVYKCILADCDSEVILLQ